MIILIYSFPCSVSGYYIFRFSLSNVIAGKQTKNYQIEIKCKLIPCR